MNEENYTYITLTRNENNPTYTFAEVQYGKIVSINHHWVPLEEYRKFFSADALFIDITGVLIDGETPTIGDCVSSSPDGYTISHFKSTYSVAESKNYIIEKLKLKRNKLELDPIEYNSNLFDADKDSLMRLDKARQSLEDNNLESISWTTANNTRVVLTIDDFKNINTAIAIRSNSLHVRYNELKDYVNNLEDKYLSVILKIDWDWDINCNLDEIIKEEDTN